MDRNKVLRKEEGIGKDHNDGRGRRGGDLEISIMENSKMSNLGERDYKDYTK